MSRAAWLVLVVGCAGAPQAPTYEVGVFKPTAQDSIVPPGSALEILWQEGDFTEGPAPAPDGSILFTDIGQRIMKFDPRTRQTTVTRDPSGKANGLMFDAKGNLLACEGAGAGGNRRISITSPAGVVRTLADRWEGKRFNSPNDLAVTKDGSVYFTDPRYVGNDPREIDFEGVFLVRPDGTVSLATRDLEKPNGILVSADGKTAYVADNNSTAKGNHHLLAFRIAPDGRLVDKRILFDIGPDKRGIDGMTLDVKGNIYATAGRGELGGIYVFDPEGRHLAFIRTPGDPTNCVFGGASEPTSLYITTATPKKYALARITLAHAGWHVSSPK